jgi:hypothetical protein
MDPVGQEIVRHLEEVAAERRARHEEPALAERVHALKDYQHRRFQQTYADLLAQPRYSEAARFFLDELYGPHDFTARDAQFARIVPALVRLFPRHIVETVSTLGHLHALSEQLDTAMARHLTELPLTAAAYAEAWRRVGRADDRERQIAFMHAIGSELDHYTANPLLRHTLRMMRRPAAVAGLGALQRFLETGFDTFRALRGAESFLQTISARERDLAGRLFDPIEPVPADFLAAEVTARQADPGKA